MPIKLFNLRGVPDDEAEEIRELLTSNRIDYHETPGGNWAISAPAIWLNDDSQWHKAKELINQYQRERLIRVREEYSQLRKEGKHRTIADIISENSIRFIIYLTAIAAIIYFSTKPFISIGT